MLATMRDAAEQGYNKSDDKEGRLQNHGSNNNEGQAE